MENLIAPSAIELVVHRCDSHTVYRSGGQSSFFTLITSIRWLLKRRY
jgi:hypothetical protein